MERFRGSRAVMRAAPVAVVTAALGLGLFAQAAVARPTGQGTRGVTAVAATGAAEGRIASAQAGANRITITARDFAFDAPPTLPTGVSAFTLINNGAEDHHGELLRLNDGVTPEQFGQAFSGSPDAVFALITDEGGPGTVNPGGTGNDVFLDLKAGNYLLVCFIAGDDGIPHIAKGMVQPITVVPPSTTAQAPQSSATIDMFDFGYTIPQLSAGQQTLKITNSGPQAHEFDVMQIPDDVTPEQLAAALQAMGPPPFPTTQISGFNGINAGGTGWLSLNLSAGTYVALCFIPDAATGKPHVELGMVQPFRVQ